MKITDSSNMDTVNHATENLQHRILDFSNYCSVITRRQRERHRARRERRTEEQRIARLPKRREYDRRRYAAVIMTIEQHQRRSQRRRQERHKKICENRGEKTLRALKYSGSPPDV